MHQRAIVICAGALLALCFLQTPKVFAQTPAEVGNLATRLGDLSLQLGVLRGNLLQMEAVSSRDEAEIVASASEIAGTADATIEAVWILADIYTLMIHPKDRETVRSYLRIFSKKAVGVSDIAVRGINQNLPRINSPAVVEESRKLRDVIQRSREEISRAMQGN